MLFLPKRITIKCNNHQIIQVLIDKSTKLQIKLRHINIYFHWSYKTIDIMSVDKNLLGAHKRNKSQ